MESKEKKKTKRKGRKRKRKEKEKKRLEVSFFAGDRIVKRCYHERNLKEVLSTPLVFISFPVIVIGVFIHFLELH